MDRSYRIDVDFDLAKIQAQFRRIFELALSFLNTRHNKIHTFIVYQYALVLLEEELGAPEIVIPASILHDVGWSSVPEEKQLEAFGPDVGEVELQRKHEIEGAAIAQRLLKGLGYDPQGVSKIVAIVEGHDTIPGATSIEDAITKDADKLWRFSERGFDIDCQRFNVEPLPWIRFLFGKIDEWFLTKTGREIATCEAQKREKEIREEQR